MSNTSRLCGALSLTLLLSMARPVSSQQPGPVVRTSQRVRITLKAEVLAIGGGWQRQQLVGNFVGLHSDTVRLTQQRTTVPIGLSAIHGVEVRTAHKSGLVTGALLGLLGGTLMGAGVAAISKDMEGYFLLGPAFGAGIGVMGGGLIGLLNPRQTWQPASLPRDSL